jgi:hypothetical protein
MSQTHANHRDFDTDMGLSTMPIGFDEELRDQSCNRVRQNFRPSKTRPAIY